jgi:hypothetical protein
MKPSHVAVVLVFLGGALGLVLLDRKDQEEKLEALDGRLSALSAQEIARRKAALDPGRLHARGAVAAPPAAMSPPDPAGAAPARTAAEDKARPPMEPAEVRARLDTVFERERTDPSWRAQAVTTAQTKLAEILPASSKIRSIECRTSMCRFETAHQDPESYRQFLTSAFQDPATKLWNGGGFSTPLADHDEGGRVVTVAFLAREGQSLPPVWQDE